MSNLVVLDYGSSDHWGHRDFKWNNWSRIDKDMNCVKNDRTPMPPSLDWGHRVEWRHMCGCTCSESIHSIVCQTYFLFKNIKEWWSSLKWTKHNYAIIKYYKSHIAVIILVIKKKKKSCGCIPPFSTPSIFNYVPRVSRIGACAK